MTDDVELALLRRDVEQMQAQIAELTKQVSLLADAWTAANNVVGFVKWLAGAVAAVGVLWTAIKMIGGR